MSDVEDFFAEQHDVINMPDESLEDYVARMAVVMNRDIILPQATRNARTPEPEEDQARASSVKRRTVDASPLPESPSHEGSSTHKRRKNEHNPEEAATSKKQKRDETAVASTPVDKKHEPVNILRNAPLHLSITEQPGSTAKTSTDDHEHPSNRAITKRAIGAHLEASIPMVHSHTQGLHHNNLDAAPVSLLKVSETSKTPHSPSVPNDKTTLSNPETSEPGINPRHRRSQSNFAPHATFTPTPELPLQFMPKHDESDQPIHKTRAKLISSTNAAHPLDMSASTLVPHLASRPSEPTSGWPSHLVKLPPTKNKLYTVGSSAVSSCSNVILKRPTPGTSTAKVISGFVPQTTSTQHPATSKDPGSIQSKVSNFSKSTSTPKRDRVLKPTPKLVVEADINNTTPDATKPPDALVAGVSSTSEGASKTRSAGSKGKKPAATKSKKKERELVTPLAYAQILCNKLDVLAMKTNFLRGKRLFYTGGDMQYASQSTKKKMESIIRNGGILVPDYDPKLVTHVITDAAERPTLRALGLKSLNDVASNMPIVTWSWVTEGRGRTGLTEKEHAAFPSHIVDTVTRSKSELDSSWEISRISEFTHDGLLPVPLDSHLSPSASRPVSPRNTFDFLKPSIEQAASTSNSAHAHKSDIANDPLAEFYDLAKAERDNDCSEYEYHGNSEDEKSDDGETDDEYHGDAGPPIKRGFTCDSKVSRLEDSKNRDIIEKLQELMELHKSKPSKDDFWRGFTYSRSIGPIRNHPRRIRSYAEARSIRGVGHRTAEKIMEIIQTGGLRRIAYETTDDVEAAKIFTGIYGVGQTIAYRWYAGGCRTLDDVRAGKGGVKLTPAMEIGLRFYDDINTRMPRGEAEEIFNLIKPIALGLDPRLFIEIMGSFRRGKKDCGDIDIMITRPTDDNKTHAGIVPRLLQALRQAGIVTEDLALPEDLHAPEAIYRGLCKLPDTVDDRGKIVPKLRRRIDILSIPWQNRGAALLYYTGDDIFNRAMRFKANKLGYSLNQRGLFQGVVRDPQDRRFKTNTGSIIASETEEEIFKILGVPWQEPHERVRSQ